MNTKQFKLIKILKLKEENIIDDENLIEEKSDTNQKITFEENEIPIIEGFENKKYQKYF